MTSPPPDADELRELLVESKRRTLLLEALAWSTAPNPAMQPAFELSGTDIPAASATGRRNVFSVPNRKVRGGGVIRVRSQYLWAEWFVVEDRDAEPERIQTATTGPASEAYLYISSAAVVSFRVARRWAAAVDPVVDIRTGLAGAVAAATVPPERVAAAFLPSVRPAELERPARDYFFSAGGVGTTPTDGAGVPPATTRQPLLYMTGARRRARVAVSGSALTFEALLPDTGAAVAAWPVMHSVTVAPGAVAEFPVGVWGLLTATNAGISAANVHVQLV